MTTSNVLKFFSLTANAQRQILDELMSIRLKTPTRQRSPTRIVRLYEEEHIGRFADASGVAKVLAQYPSVYNELCNKVLRADTPPLEPCDAPDAKTYLVQLFDWVGHQYAEPVETENEAESAIKEIFDEIRKSVDEAEQRLLEKFVRHVEP